MLPLITEKSCEPQDTQDVIINLLTISIEPYKAYGPFFHITTLLIMFAVLWKPGRMGQLMAGYIAFNYFIIATTQTMGQTEKHGFVIHLPALLTVLILGITWLIVALRSDIQPMPKKPSAPTMDCLRLPAGILETLCRCQWDDSPVL